MLDGAARIGRSGAAAVAMASPLWRSRITATCYGVLDFYIKRPRARHHADHRQPEAYMERSRHRAPGTEGPIDDTGAQGVRGDEALTTLTVLAETTTGLQEPSSALFGRPTSRVTTTSLASTGSCWSAITTVSSRHRLPGRRVWPKPSSRRTSTLPRSWRDATGHLRQGNLFVSCRITGSMHSGGRIRPHTDRRALDAR